MLRDAGRVRGVGAGRWADGEVPARHGRRAVLRSHLRRVELALEELLVALRSSNLTESL